MSGLLAWVDLETTGLHASTDSILEAGVIITNDDLQILTSKSVIVFPAGRPLHLAEPIVREMHSRSGLEKEIRTGETLIDAEQILVHFLTANIKPGESPMCGSSVGFDRAFLQHWMPLVDQHFHYRNIDISSVKELAKRWRPQVAESTPYPRKRHRVIDDLLDTIEEARHYRTHLF